jgi:hypothetical protein
MESKECVNWPAIVQRRANEEWDGEEQKTFDFITRRCVIEATEARIVLLQWVDVSQLIHTGITSTSRSIVTMPVRVAH